VTHQKCLKCCHIWQAPAQTVCPVCVAIHRNLKTPAELGQPRRTCTKCSYTWHSDARPCPACNHSYAKVTS
jgi:rubrerythrin